MCTSRVRMNVEHEHPAVNLPKSSPSWSAANVSDAPSRGDVSYCRDVLRATYVATWLPELDLWLSPAGRWMDLALRDVPAQRSRGRDRARVAP